MWFSWMTLAHLLKHRKEGVLISRGDRIPDQSHECVLWGLCPWRQPQRGGRPINVVSRTMLECRPAKRLNEMREILEEGMRIGIHPTCRRITAEGQHDESDALIYLGLRRSFYARYRHLHSEKVRLPRNLTQKRNPLNVRNGSLADIRERIRDVRFIPRGRLLILGIKVC